MSISTDYSMLNKIGGLSAQDMAGTYANLAVSVPRAQGGFMNVAHIAAGSGTQDLSKGQVEMKPDENAVRQVRAVQERPKYKPEEALTLTMERVSKLTPKDTAQVGHGGVDQSQQAKAWLTNSRFFSAKTRMDQGLRIVNKVDPKAFDRIDPDKELRLGLAQYHPKDTHAIRFNAQELLADKPKADVKPTLKTDTNNLQGKLAGTINKYRKLADMPKPGALKLVSQLVEGVSPEMAIVVRTVGAAASTFTGANRPSPSMGARRRPLATPAFS